MQSFGVDRLRNVVLVSHSGAGKTSTAEAILFTIKTTTRLGKVEEGTTVSDYEPEEIKRGSSIQTSVLPCVWREHKLNLLDTPGYADFVGEVFSGLRAADAAILAVAAPSAVEVGTEQMWHRLQERHLPCLIFINKMDRENADFSGSLAKIQERFGKHCVALNIPIGAAQSFQGIVDLLNPGDVPASMASQTEEARERLVEAVAESDDELATKYLEGEELTQKELTDALRQGTFSGRLVPVLVGSATQNVGVEALLDAVVSFLPSPADIGEVEATNSGTNDTVKLPSSVDGPLAALVFKTTADPFVGKLSYFRVYSGTLKGTSEVWNSNHRQQERVGQLFVLRGKSQEQAPEVTAGDIGAVAKLTATATGDTLAQRDNPLTLPGVHFPTPSYVVAVHPKSKADLDKMSTALTRLVEEDPSLRVSQEQDTGEMVLSGMGDSHVEVVAEKAKRKFGTDLILSLPRVAYKETITTSTKVEYKHKKQTGGHGQYGHVLLELEPQPRSQGFEFGKKVVGGKVPKEYIPAVEKGVIKALQEGIIAGFPVVDIKVVLYDGSYHPVDSSGMSFEIAGNYALRKGVAQGNPVILEPIMRLRVTVPDTFTGDVNGDLNGKRAKILGMTPQDGMTVIEAEAPQAEVLRYATDLRSLTQGRGSFTMELVRYEEVPPHLVQRISEEAKKRETAKA